MYNNSDGEMIGRNALTNSLFNEDGYYFNSTPPVIEEFLLLGGTNFLLLNGTNFDLL